MAATRRGSEAERELAAAARRAGGRGVTPRRIERWRQEGLIRQPVRRWLGRGKGSRSTYLPEAVAQVVELSRLARPDRNPERAALILFVRRRWVAETTLRRAYRAHLANFVQGLRARTASTNAFEIAEVAASRMSERLPRLAVGRRFLRSARGRTESPSSIALSVLTNVFHSALGGHPTREGLEEVLSVAGADLDERLESPHSEPELMKVLRSTGTVSSLRTAMAAASVPDLEAARDDLSRLLLSARVFERVLTRTLQGGAERFAWARLVTDDGFEQVVIYGTLGLLLLRQHLGDRVDGLLEGWRRELPRYQAMDRLLDALPRRSWRYLGQDGAVRLAAKPARDRERLYALIRKHWKEHPADEALITRPT